MAIHIHRDPSGLQGRDGLIPILQHDGLFQNAVFSMTTARDGSRWVGSFGGVARLKPS